MLSARCMVANLWAITREVFPFVISLVAFWISFYACVSIEEVASSKTKILGCMT